MKLNETQRWWLHALRSGKFRQGREYLCQGFGRDTQYCCLGVAANICGVRPKYMRDGTEKLDLDDLGPDSKERIADLRLRTPDGSFDAAHTPVGMHYASLIELNDVAGWTFEEIADFIEENPEAVFKGGE